MFSSSCATKVVCVNNFTSKVSNSYNYVRSILQFESNFSFVNSRVREHVYREICIVFLNCQWLVRNANHKCIRSSQLEVVTISSNTLNCSFFSSLRHSESNFRSTTEVTSHNQQDVSCSYRHGTTINRKRYEVVQITVNDCVRLCLSKVSKLTCSSIKNVDFTKDLLTNSSTLIDQADLHESDICVIKHFHNVTDFQWLTILRSYLAKCTDTISIVT